MSNINSIKEVQHKLLEIRKKWNIKRSNISKVLSEYITNTDEESTWTIPTLIDGYTISTFKVEEVGILLRVVVNLGVEIYTVNYEHYRLTGKISSYLINGWTGVPIKTIDLGMNPSKEEIINSFEEQLTNILSGYPHIW